MLILARVFRTTVLRRQAERASRPMIAVLVTIGLTVTPACRDRVSESKTAAHRPLQVTAAIERGRFDRSTKTRLLADLFDSDDPMVRERAALAVGRLKDDAFVERLILLLEDAHPVVRRRAAFALAQIGDRLALRATKKAKARQIRGALWRRLDEETEPLVRHQCFVGLARFATPADIAHLERAVARPDLQHDEGLYQAVGILAHRHRASPRLVKGLFEQIEKLRGPAKTTALWAATATYSAIAPSISLAFAFDPSAGGLEDRIFALGALTPQIARQRRKSLLQMWSTDVPLMQRAALRWLMRFPNGRVSAMAEQLRQRCCQRPTDILRLSKAEVSHVVMTLLAMRARTDVAAVRAFAAEMTGRVERMIERDLSEHQRLHLDLIHCAASIVQDISVGRPDKVAHCGPLHSQRLTSMWRRLQVIDVIDRVSRSPRWKQLFLKRYLDAPEVEVRAVAHAALRRAGWLPEMRNLGAHHSVAVDAPRTRAFVSDGASAVGQQQMRLKTSAGAITVWLQQRAARRAVGFLVDAVVSGHLADAAIINRYRSRIELALGVKKRRYPRHSGRCGRGWGLGCGAGVVGGRTRGFAGWGRGGVARWACRPG